MSTIFGTSVLLVYTICTATVAVIVHITGTVTPRWVITEYGPKGLYESDISFAVVLVTIGVVTAFGAIICYTAYAFWIQTSSTLRRISWMFSAMASFLTLIGTGVYGIQNSTVRRDVDNLGYSFGLVVLAGLLHAIPVALVELDRRKRFRSGQLLE